MFMPARLTTVDMVAVAFSFFGRLSFSSVVYRFVVPVPARSPSRPRPRLSLRGVAFDAHPKSSHPRLIRTLTSLLL